MAHLSCPVERRRPTRPLARGRASPTPCGAGRGWGEGGTGGRRPGVGWHPARVRGVWGRAGAPGGPVRRVWVGGPPRWRGERGKKGVGREGSGWWQGGASPPLTTPAPSAPTRASPPPAGRHRHPTPGVAGRPPARHRAAYPTAAVVVCPPGASLARPPARPPRHVVRPSEVWVRGFRGVGVPSPPTRASVSGALHAPPGRDRPPPARSLRRVSGWGAAAAAAAAAAPCGGPFARPSVRPLPAAGPGPVPPPVGRRPSAPGPPPPRRAPSTYLSLRAPGPLRRRRRLLLLLGRSSVRLSLAPSLPPSPRVCPLPARPPVPVEASLPPSVARRGPGTRVRGQGAAGAVGLLWWGSGAERRGPRSGRERGVVVGGGRRQEVGGVPGRFLGDTRSLGASSGGGRGVSCGGRPGARPGPRVTGR